jgi:hypothetical protein
MGNQGQLDQKIKIKISSGTISALNFTFHVSGDRP